MLITEFHTNFKFSLDKADGLNYPNFEPEEIDLLLNQAQDRFVKQRYGGNNIKRTSFEQTQKRIEDLKEVIETVRLTGLKANSESIIYNSAMCEIPENHWFTVWERAILNCTTCNTIVKRGVGPIGLEGGDNLITGQYVRVRPITHNEFDKTVYDAFEQPNQNEILRLMYKNQVELIIPEDCTLVSYEFRYVREPIRMSLDNDITCELSNHTHQEILDLAVQIALENIEAKRNNTFTPIINNQNE